VKRPGRVRAGSVDDRDPLQQGLKRVASVTLTPADLVDDRDPLQQGLKPELEDVLATAEEVDDRDPLQQGLKLQKDEQDLPEPPRVSTTVIHYNKD